MGICLQVSLVSITYQCTMALLIIFLGSVLLSANIKIPTLLSYLQETEQKGIEHIKSIVAGKWFTFRLHVPY